MQDPFIVAEIGVNHGGSLATALQMVDAARECGAHAVKFQTFRAGALASSSTPKVPYQERHIQSASHLSMLEALELSRDDHTVIKSHCDSLGIEFFSTPYSQEDAKFLVELGVDRIKVASADIVDELLLEFISQQQASVMVSTGMATDQEIKRALEILTSHAAPSVTLMHTTSMYPTPDSSARMLRLNRLAEFGYPLGFSDHTEGDLAAVIALALGARCFERHFTLDRGLDGPDHFASSDPGEFRRYVSHIRRSFEMIRNSDNTMTSDEVKMAQTSRKSIHARRHLSAGHTITERDLKLMRPGTGLYWGDKAAIIGRRLVRPIYPNEQILRGDVS